jgi:signal transduction histidine kinase
VVPAAISAERDRQVPDSPRRIAGDLAGVLAIVISVLLPGLEAAQVAVSRLDNSDVVIAVLAASFAIAVEVHHVRHVLRGERPHFAFVSFVLQAVVVYVAIGIVGSAFARASAVVMASALMLFSWRTGLVIALTLEAAVVTLVAVHEGGANAASAFVALVVPWRAISLLTVVALSLALRRHATARAAFRTDAVSSERNRVDSDIQATVGAAMERIAANATAIDLADPESDTRIARIGADARAALAAARSTIAAYRVSGSRRAELEIATALLTAAGVPLDANIEDSSLDEAADELFRSTMHDAVANLLATPIVEGETVLIGIDPTGRVTTRMVTRR